MNHLQVIGSHNSYHIAPADGVKAFISSLGKDTFARLDYTHPPLTEQFTKQGIRQIELDLYADTKGGLYANPYGRQQRNPGPDPNAKGELNAPGFKVLHIPDIDYLSTVPTLSQALREVRTWSRANPNHVPILVLLELKDQGISLLPTKPEKWTAGLLDELDAELRKHFPPGAMITPDDVRGTHESLSRAIVENGWPTLKEARGRVMFAMDNEGALAELYRKKAPNLKGRVLFTMAPEGDPAAGFFKLNDPVKDFEKIQRLVKQGFWVRTRADAETKEARANDSTRRDKALASGAQCVSTDFRVARNEFSAYECKLPGGVVARANPVVGPAKEGELE